MADAHRAESDASPNERRHQRQRWRALAILAVACGWIILVRIPLVLNADAHLDSDLAVDGLTLVDATHGIWRWHYPGTPHIGILPVAFSLPQAAVWGANVWTLTSGGVVAYLLAVIAIFALAWRVFGCRVACWSLVPLAFASTGVVWLSGRVTGAHFTAVAWTAITLLLLANFARAGRLWRAFILGLWAGVGLYVDNISLLALLAIAPSLAYVATAHRNTRSASSVWGDILLSIVGLAPLVLAAAGTLLGYQLQVIGERADPHNPYGAQFESILRAESNHQRDWNAIKTMAQEHVRLLFAECFPRLISGHKLPGLQTDPTPETFRGRVAPRDPPQWEAIPIATTIVTLGLAAGALWTLIVRRQPAVCSESPSQSLARRAVVAALVLFLALYSGAFLMNRNIYNSDNYRYLVVLIIPLAIGSGLLLERLSARGRAAHWATLTAIVVFGALVTLDTARWYQRFGWVDSRGVPVHVAAPDPAVAWLEAHPEIDSIFGNYWDVYRLSFLTGGRVTGVPYRNYPDRFGIADKFPKGRPRFMLGGRDRMGAFYRQLALSEGGQVVHEAPTFWIIDWPIDSP